jgi:hypothetical protein
VSSVGFVRELCCWFSSVEVWNIPLVGPFEVDRGKPRSILPCIECDCCDCLADSVAHRDCFAEFVFDLSTRVCL